MFTIYRALNKKTGKSYIGQTKRHLLDRIDSHYSNSALTKFANALRESEVVDWEWSAIDTAETIEEAQEKEGKYVSDYRAMTDGYNSPNGVVTYNRESRHKMAAMKKEKRPWNAGLTNCYSEETRRKMAYAKLGSKVVQDEEWKKNKREALQKSVGRAVICNHTGKEFPSVGEAARQLGVAHSTAKRILSGKIKNGTISIRYKN